MIALLVDIVVGFVGEELAVFTLSFTVVAALGLVILAMWVEESFFLMMRDRSLGIRLAGTFIFAVVAPTSMLLMAFVWSALLSLLSIESMLPLLWLLSGVAASLAAIGTLLVLFIDGGIQVTRPVLRTRIMATVLGLGFVAFLISVTATATVLSLQTAIKWARGTDFTVGYWFDRMTVVNAVDYLDSNTFLVAIAVHVVAAAASLPTAISASNKLASSVVERVEPLGHGFRELAHGDRDIEVEVGGSRDVIELIRRFNEMVTELRLAERMERAFGVYVSDQVLGRIRDQHGECELPAQLRDATVFFADIRGFTAMSEKLTPEQVLSILNRYYDRVVAIIDTHAGYLDKFIGDAVVVVFNGPIDQPDHAERAVRCAIEIQKVIEEMNTNGEFPEIGELHVGAGICTGPMVCGNVGSSQQMEYTVIGDTVNLAARFCGHASAGEVWINAGCAADLSMKELPFVGLEPMLVKGKQEPVVPHRVWPAPKEGEKIGIREATRDTVDDSANTITDSTSERANVDTGGHKSPALAKI